MQKSPLLQQLSSMKARIAIFASGAGTNAQNLIKHFRTSDVAQVVLVLTNKPQAPVIQKAAALGVPFRTFTKQELNQTDGVLQLLQEAQADWIVLAGFLLKVPANLIDAYPNRIINIHPALLPKYGGKGMYGQHVHQAVLQAGESETGISIHYVNEHYDEGAIIAQRKVALGQDETVRSIADKVHALEYRWFPQIIEETITLHP